MADVFISYSKARKAEAETLAGELGELGYDVWWDTSLVPTGAFADEIDRQLDAASAVIVIWSQESRKSKWVRSEASHAERQEKLVNVMTSCITAVEIPKPFDQNHAVGLDEIRDIVRALDILNVARSVAPIAAEPEPEPESIADGDDRLFAEAEHVGTPAAYQYYLDELPDGRHAAVARFRVKMAGEASPGPQVAAPKRDGKTRVMVGLPGSEQERWLSPGESIQDAPFAPEMVLVSPGKFWMGSKDGEGAAAERPRHEVTIGHPLLVGKYPVTFEEWDAFDRAGGIVETKKTSTGLIFNKTGTTREKYTPGDEGWGRGRRPVINVSWHDAQAYAKWLSETTGKTYRLLSEAEWEYACRAGTETAYSFGDESKIGDYAWYSANSDDKTQPVGGKKPNGFGLYDMHGNVWEWCEDVWTGSYQGAPVDGSARTSADTSVSRVSRCGSWYIPPGALRSAYRYWARPGLRYGGNGFRLARTLNPTP